MFKHFIDMFTSIYYFQILSNNSSISITMFQSFTKTSAMMIGEIDTNEILGLENWTANLLLIAFELIAIILLMNLMVTHLINIIM